MKLFESPEPAPSCCSNNLVGDPPALSSVDGWFGAAGGGPAGVVTGVVAGFVVAGTLVGFVVALFAAGGVDDEHPARARMPAVRMMIFLFMMPFPSQIAAS